VFIGLCQHSSYQRAIKDLYARTFKDLYVRQDGKQPDGLTLIPWQGGKWLAWDVTVVSTLAQSYVDWAATGVGMLEELAAERKLVKYSNLTTNLILQPIAVENLGAFSSSSSDFISALGHKISSVSDEERETSSLFQRLSVAFNTILHDTS